MSLQHAILGQAVLTCQSTSLDQTAKIAETLVELLKSHGRIMTLSGTLGSGKTTLAQSIVRLLASDKDLIVPSPTFNYVHEYGVYPKIYHFDLYRLNNPQEIIAMGFDEMLQDEAAFCLIEWPEIAYAFLPKKILQVTIEQHNETTRNITARL